MTKIKDYINKITHKPLVIIPISVLLATTVITGGILIYSNVMAKEAYSNMQEIENDKIVLKTNEVQNLDTENEKNSATLIKLTCSSDSLDMTIKVQTREYGAMVTGNIFTFTITPPEGDAYEVVNEDKTGDIHLIDLKEGVYKVLLHDDINGYKAPEEIEVKVEPAKTYDVVDVSNDVVLSSEINAAEEDAQYNKLGARGEDTQQTEAIEEVTVPQTPTPEPAPAPATTPESTIEPTTTTETTQKTTQEPTATQEPMPTPTPIPIQKPICGWQMVNNNLEYLDANGNAVTGIKKIDEKAYHFTGDGVYEGQVGIDVSEYQHTINWQQVKESGINFAIIRLGFRGYCSGKLVLDERFIENINGATNAGLKVGVYFFTQAITEQEAIEEASMCIKYVSGYQISYPIAIDTEYINDSDVRANNLSQADRTKICEAFCKTVQKAGYVPAVYASESWLYHNLNMSDLSSYMTWLAHYTTETDYTGSYGIWQYTSVGRINGISTNVDMNISYIEPKPTCS